MGERAEEVEDQDAEREGEEEEGQQDAEKNLEIKKQKFFFIMTKTVYLISVTRCCNLNWPNYLNSCPESSNSSLK